MLGDNSFSSVNTSTSHPTSVSGVGVEERWNALLSNVYIIFVLKLLILGIVIERSPIFVIFYNIDHV